MLADPRADALGARFAAQWLRLQDVDKVHPGSELLSRTSTSNLADAMRTRDRAVLQQPRARGPQPARSATRRLHVRERAARAALRHSRASPATSSAACTYPDDTRRGILGQGSMLVQTSLANRTSPVLRGKWVMEVLLGTPPPPPPPDVPDARGDRPRRRTARMLTTRERMEMHRANPTCNVVPPVHGSDRPRARQLRRHRASGASARTACRSTRAGDFYDGTPVTTPAELTRGAAEAADAAGAHVHREPDGLRARPPRRVLRPADDSRDRARRPKRTTTRCRRSSWAS